MHGIRLRSLLRRGRVRARQCEEYCQREIECRERLQPLAIPVHGYREPVVVVCVLEAEGGASRDGGGRIGGRSVPRRRFCTSISENSMAGAAAATGICPDSAPHIPLKTCIVSPVTIILFRESSGVPTMSTPRTSSSGRPSAYTRYTITGST